jgi:chemotaxis protein CheD
MSGSSEIIRAEISFIAPSFGYLKQIMNRVMLNTEMKLPPEALPGFEDIKRHWDPTRKTWAAKVLPGQYYVTYQEEIITTVLGSCVSACIRDRIFAIGGMNHFLLSVGDNQSKTNGAWASAATRYGNYAMEHLINDILKHGGRRENLEVKIFGGGRIINEMSDVGRHNIEFVLQYLRLEGLRLVARDVGDIYPRKIVFYPLSGRVSVKKLRALHNNTIIERESGYLHDLQQRPTVGDVELFVD